MNKKLPLVLASSSPRRRQLLALGGWEFEISPADVDETPKANESALDYVQRLGLEKAQKVAASLTEESIVIAADTIVEVDGHILGKPADVDEARDILARLRGREHMAHSGMTLLRTSDGAIRSDLASSAVPMRNYGDEEIEAYIASGDPFDKAGAYAIQNASFAPVQGFSGCFANVMGLPLCHLARNLQKWELAFSADIPDACQAHLGYDCPIYSKVLTWEL